MNDQWQTSNNKTKPRVYVGNLPLHKPNLLTSKLIQLFANSNVAIQTDNVTIIQPKQQQQQTSFSSSTSSCFALIECKTLDDAQEAIKCLNGIGFMGNKITVQKEKKKVHNKNSNTKWNFNTNSSFGGGWMKPTGNKSSHHENVVLKSTKKKEHENTSISKQPVSKINFSNSIGMSKSINNNNDYDNEIDSFYSRCKLDMNHLMEEYGEYDPNFDKMKIDTEVTTNQDIVDNNDSRRCIVYDENTSTNPTTNDHHIGGMLAPNGHAPIDIELVSFGYKYSVPPQARQGWSYSNPLSPIDCRDLPRCPHYVAKLSGLSFKVKKALLGNTYGMDDINGENEGEEEGCEKSQSFSNPLRLQSYKHSETIFKAIEESIRDGSHGYAFPLKATIFIGSEYGRHRSVVLCDVIAQNLRKMLRENIGNRISVPISVSLRHRDVDKSHKDEEAFGDDLRRQYEVEVKRKKRQEWLESKSERIW